MDLQTLSTQMAVLIQKHQMVVTEMKTDPQNPVLQRQLSDLQKELVSLSEKQKQVVQQLRTNLKMKQCPTNIVSNVFPGNHTSTQSSTVQTHVNMVCSAQKPTVNHRLTAPNVSLASKPMTNCVNSLCQSVPPNANSIASTTATLTFKAPVGTVVLPNCSTATAQQKLHPVLVVPSPSNQGADGAQTGVLLNLMPPIRVPQYHPPSPRSTAPVSLSKAQNADNCIQINTAVTTSSCHSSPNVSSPSSEKSLAFQPCSLNNNIGKQNALHESEKQIPVNKVDKKKVDFMHSLCLIPRESLHEIKSKKMERKRRSTANPQFSNAALEEKQRNAAQQALTQPVKRPRGRPRLDSKPVPCPSNGVCAVSEGQVTTTRANTSPVPTTAIITTAATTVTSNSFPVVPSVVSLPITTVAVVNGMHRQISHTAEEKKVEQLLSGLCIVCTQPGDLIKCDTCATQQHLGCMQPPLTKRPEGPWQCNDCLSRSDPLATVRSYDALKAAKEDEKRKLLKKSLELRLKRSQLEGKLHQLNDVSSKQKDRQSELQLSLKKAEISLEQFKCIITNIQKFS